MSSFPAKSSKKRGFTAHKKVSIFFTITSMKIRRIFKIAVISNTCTLDMAVALLLCDNKANSSFLNFLIHKRRRKKMKKF